LRRKRLGSGSELAPQAGGVAGCGNLRIDTGRRACSWKGIPVPLTATEFLVLQGLADRPGIVKSRGALMDEVYGRTYVDERTIDSVVKRLRRKLRTVDAGCDLIETLYGIGYRLRVAHPTHA
jgi:two-component system response regulator ChvI